MTKDGVSDATLDKAKQPKNKNKKADDTLQLVLGMHKAWKDYRSKLMGDWTRDNKLYNNERVTKNRYKGVSDTFVPMPYGTIETMVAALATGDLSTDFIPQDIYKYLESRFIDGFDENGEQSKEDFLVAAIQEATKGGVIEDETLDVLNALYDYYWDCGDWDIELEYLIRGGLKIGAAAWWLTWKNGKPNLETIAFPDFIFDPTAKEDEQCKFMGRRYLADIDELRKEKIYNKDGKLVKRYDIPEDVDKQGSKDANDKTDKEMKEELLYGSTIDYDADKGSKQVEIIEIMTDDKMYTVMNRKVVIEETVNPFKAQAELAGVEYNGYLPGISYANNKDESLYVGKSEIATFWQEAERLNDVTNQKSDAVTRALLQQKRADPALKSQKNSFNVPGAVIWATAGQYDNVNQATVPNVAFSEENSIKNNIRETTATDQIVKGVGSTQDVTATEAKLQVAQAGQRIELKIKHLERGPLKQLARKVLFLVRIFITDPFIIPQSGNGGIRPLLYNPSNYTMDFEPKVKLHIDSKNQERREQEQHLQTYQILIQDPTNNLEEIKRKYLPKITGLDKDDVNAIISKPEDGGGLPPELPPEMGAI